MYGALFALAVVALPKVSQFENSTNIYANEIQSNGFYKFYCAFSNSSLDFDTFYKTIPLPKALHYSRSNCQAYKTALPFVL